MTTVLLAHSYFLKYDPKQTEKMRPYPPLATLYAASHLRSQGHAVALFDAMLSDGEHAFEQALVAQRPRIVALYEDNFNFLSKMCLSRMREAAFTMVGMARRQGALVIAAGSDASDLPEAYLAAGAHAVILGEGDHTLAELVNAMSADDERVIQHIAGIALLEGSSIKRTPQRANEKYPDVFPFPAWDLIDVETYRRAWRAAHGYFSLNMVSTRGCPFHCNWCAKPIWGQRYAMRSPANVAEEMALVKRDVRPDHIWFADDIFGLRPQWVAEFGREVAARDAAIPFMIQSRVDLMTDEAIAGLKQAGCEEVWMGAESGSQHILDAMDKGTRVRQIYEARARLKQAGIRACFFIQFGYPGETFEDILLTVKLVREALPDNIGVSVSYPLPGTKFHDMVKAQLGAKSHWTDSNDLAMMFEGTYQSPFYRKLHRVLHHDLEVHQRLAHRNNGLWHERNAIRSQLADLKREWDELRELERTSRNATPTTIIKLDAPQAPDLSQTWN